MKAPPKPRPASESDVPVLLGDHIAGGKADSGGGGVISSTVAGKPHLIGRTFLQHRRRTDFPTMPRASAVGEQIGLHLGEVRAVGAGGMGQGDLAEIPSTRILHDIVVEMKDMAGIDQREWRGIADIEAADGICRCLL